MARRMDASVRRPQLLDAAERAFGRLGWHSTRMEDVAAEAGVAKSLLFKHWPSKDALFEDLRDRLYERYRGRQEEAVRRATSEADAIAQSITAAAWFFADHPGAYLVLAAIRSGRGPDTHRSDVDLLRLEAERLATGFRRPVPGVDPREEAAFFRLLSAVSAGTTKGVLAVASRESAPDDEAPSPLAPEITAALATTLVCGGIDAISRLLRGTGLWGMDETPAGAGGGR